MLERKSICIPGTLPEMLIEDGKARIIFMLFDTKIALIIRDDLASWQDSLIH